MAEESLQPPNFPVNEMPRMGRRNAIIPDDEGFSSPANLVNRSSVSSLINEILKEKQLVMSSKSLVEEPELPKDPESTTTTTKLSEVSSIRSDSLDSQESKVEQPVSAPVVVPEVKEEEPAVPIDSSPTEIIKAASEAESNLKKARVRLDSLKEDGKQPPGNLIPWKNLHESRRTALEEKRKVFASFDTTSPDPPETPETSEAKFRKVMNKIKVKRDSESKDRLPVNLHRSTNKEKDRYAYVPARVNTHWEKGDDLKRPVSSGPIGPGTSGKPKSAKPQLSRNKTSASVPNVAMSHKQKSFLGHVILPHKFFAKKRNSEKMPLTLGPRITTRKGIAPSAQTRAQIISEVTRRLYSNGPTPIQRFKNEILRQHEQQLQQMKAAAAAAAGAENKANLFNLHRVNNVGIIGNSNYKPPQQQQTLNQLVGHISNTTAMLVGGPLRRNAPPLQTIQPPPSPFLTSNVSIPNQLGEIPLNGDLLRTFNKFKAGGGVNLGSNVEQGRAALNKMRVGKAAPQDGKRTRAAKIPPNKYNKIYIGPYSGSESEGEQDRSKGPAQASMQAEQSAEKPSSKAKRSRSKIGKV